MAAGNEVGKEIATNNVVAKDQIWKDHVTNEKSKAKNWEKNWGFLAQPYSEVIKDDLDKLVDKNRPKAEIPAHMRIPPLTPISRYIKVLPSPQPLPSTTTQEIGWRSGKREYTLERYGRYTTPKGSILKQLNWPKEAVG